MTTEALFSFHAFRADSRPRAATIGFFDGVHLGHRHLLRRLCAEAERRGLNPVAVTFDVHPRTVVADGYRPALLQTTEEKLRCLAETGIGGCAVVRFTPETARLTAAEFMARVLAEGLGVRFLLAGYDHRFGRPDGHTPADYSELGREAGIEVAVCDPTYVGGIAVSSSAVRRLLAAGDAAGAARLLGRPYALQGTVTTGHRVGRELGFPTANLRPETEEKIVPARGVYVAEAVVGGTTHAAMLNIGKRPTLDNGTETSIEAHLLDFNANLYGRCLTLRFIDRLRDERAFASLDELREQLRRDEAEVRRRLVT